MREIYLERCKSQLPRLLSMYDLDPFSETRGYGDREYWGWKSRDYCNAGLQGGVLALAGFLKLGCFQGRESRVVPIIKQIIEATGRLKYKDHGVDEIMPFEGSFCVAASLVVDLLYAIEFLEDYINQDEKERYIKLCRELIYFYANHIESHGIISNHLAAAVAGIYKYQVMTGDLTFAGQAEELLQMILMNQSAEGWYREYEGADPGYQTLATYYLAIALQLTHDERIRDSLKRSLDFLAFFIHPDGSIGGEYGSRNTQIYYPAGFEILGNDLTLAAEIADVMRESIANQRTVTLDVVDEGNFIPFMNNYLLAYIQSIPRKGKQNVSLLPFQKDAFMKTFPDAGVVVVNRSQYYAIASLKKGGVLKVFDTKQQKLFFDDGGYIGELKNHRKVTTQIYSDQAQYEIKDNVVMIQQDFFSVPSSLPTPIKFILLRLLNITVMRMAACNKFIKMWLVKLLITQKHRYNIHLQRTCLFTEHEIVISDELTNRSGQRWSWLEYGQKFSTIHMASSKYFNQHYLYHTFVPKPIDVEELNHQQYYRIENHLTMKESYDTTV